MHKKHIIKIDLILLVATVALIAFLIYFVRPSLSSPENGTVTQGPVLFSFKNGNALLIDDNVDFTSPERILVKDNLVLNLKPGVYFWKVDGTLPSEIRQLTIQSEVDLKLHKVDDEYQVVNSGNTKLKVDIYNKGTLTGNVILDVDENRNVSGTLFVGGQNE